MTAAAGTGSTMAGLRGRLLIIVLAATGVLALGGDRALANHVDCGDTITTDTTLDSDLANCPNNGIVIGADDLTLDLNGHLVDGDGSRFTGCPQDEFCDAGLLNDGHDDVTVRDGSVRQFEIGVFVGRARHNRVLNIASSRHRFFGIVVAESARSLVRGSSWNRNLAPDGDGMGLFGSHRIRIVGNSFRHNPGPGIHVAESNENLIKRNLIARNSPGILIEGNGNRVRRNRCARNGACILVGTGNRNVIVRNHVFRGRSGIGIEKGRGNLVARNVVVHTRGNGIYLALSNPPIGGGNNSVRRNRVSGSGDDAFKVRESDSRSVLTRNVAVGAGDDGFDVNSRSTKLTANRAGRNADLGIEGRRGVIDGGANIARHNGDPRQCTHISCR